MNVLLIYKSQSTEIHDAEAEKVTFQILSYLHSENVEYDLNPVLLLE